MVLYTSGFPRMVFLSLNHSRAVSIRCTDSEAHHSNAALFNHIRCEFLPCNEKTFKFQIQPNYPQTNID